MSKKPPDFDPHDVEMLLVDVTVDDFPKDKLANRTEDPVMESAARHIALLKRKHVQVVRTRYLKKSFRVLKSTPGSDKSIIFGRVEVYYVMKVSEK